MPWVAPGVPPERHQSATLGECLARYDTRLRNGPLAPPGVELSEPGAPKLAQAAVRLVRTLEDLGSTPIRLEREHRWFRDRKAETRKMGADPSSWNTEIPSIYSLGN